MRILIILLLFGSLVNYSFGQVDMMERKKLYELLEQRKLKFDDYSNSLERKTGLFGNKTKKDMQASNDVLREIVKTDNQIISVLNRAIDFKSFEKVNLNYTEKENSSQLNNLLQASDTLSKQVQSLTDKNKKMNTQLLWYKIANRSLLLLMILSIIFYFNRKKKS